jgi:hypothetical protein
MPSVAVCVHHLVSTHSAPTSGVRSSSRPVSSRPVSGHLARPVRCPPVRCPVSWCPPSARSHPSRPRKPGGGLGDHVGAAGNLDGRDGSSCTWSAVSRVAWSTARVGLGAMLWRWCVSRWGSGGRGPGRVGPGRRLRPCSTADRPGGGQPGVRVAGGCRLSQAWERGSKPGVPAPECGRHLGLEHDYAAWSLWSLMARWTGLEGPTRSTVRMVCGPSAAQPGVSEPGWGPTAL